jgi:hypothetical protein
MGSSEMLRADRQREHGGSRCHGAKGRRQIHDSDCCINSNGARAPCMGAPALSCHAIVDPYTGHSDTKRRSLGYNDPGHRHRSLSLRLGKPSARSMHARPFVPAYARLFGPDGGVHDAAVRVGAGGSRQSPRSLGQRRAQNVKLAMASLGLPAQQILVSSRVKLDALGSSEAGWARDRRVEVALAD